MFMWCLGSLKVAYAATLEMSYKVTWCQVRCSAGPTVPRRRPQACSEGQRGIIVPPNASSARSHKRSTSWSKVSSRRFPGASGGEDIPVVLLGSKTTATMFGMYGFGPLGLYRPHFGDNLSRLRAPGIALLPRASLGWMSCDDLAGNQLRRKEEQGLYFLWLLVVVVSSLASHMVMFKVSAEWENRIMVFLPAAHTLRIYTVLPLPQYRCQ